MSTDPLNELLARLKAQSSAMLAAAKARDWDALATLEKGRAPDLIQLAALITPLKHGDAPLPPSISSSIAALLALENETIPLVEQARNATLEELQSLGSSRRLKNLYGSVGSDNPGL